MSTPNNLKQRFERGNIVEKLIYINILLFVLTLLMSIFQSLYKNDNNWIIQWFSLEADINSLFTKPWTMITYGFLHADFIHILFNLIALYFIGNLFIDYFTQKQLLTFYILGTFFGGVILSGVPLGIATRQGIVNRNLEIERIKQEIEKDLIEIKKLTSDQGLEKFAREEYHMKKSNEDIYIIEYEDSIRKQKGDD